MTREEFDGLKPGERVRSSITGWTGTVMGPVYCLEIETDPQPKGALPVADLVYVRDGAYLERVTEDQE
jgi:hypothetical protein